MLEKFLSSSQAFGAIAFDQIKSSEFLPATEAALKLSKANLQKIETENHPNFKNTIEALELSSLALDQISTLFFNLYSACTDDDIDASVGPISEMLAEHGNDIQLSEALFRNIKKVYESAEAKSLSKEGKKLLEETYQSFTRNGALLNEQGKKQLREIDRQLASLNPQFSQNLLKATNAFSLNVSDKSLVQSLPESVIAPAKEEAEKRGESGYTFTLQAPSYVPFMKYMPDRALREKMWRAYNSKALDGEFSNREICQQIAKLRHQRAELLGYKNHAEFVLEKRMAKSPARVLEFIEELKKPSLEAARRDVEELRQFVQAELGETIDIKPWDFSFYSEKLKKHRYDINDEDLRPYFPLENVIQGVFTHGEKLFGLKFTEQKDLPTYHPEVSCYRVDKDGRFMGLLYLDIFPRDNKKSGAWMTNYKEQGFNGDTVTRPHVSLVCNFTKPSADRPSLLTFAEVQTLFHEFGHGLHSLLSDCHYRSLSGTNVLWDFVELPSQIMENWTFEKESLSLFAKHYKTGETIPDSLIAKLRKARNFQAGYGSLRQISFSLVDMNWHTDIKGKNLDPVVMEDEATRDLQLLPKIENSNFSVSFSHVFAGGYSAGYYSYKWAEVLDADAFEAFLEKGIFDRTTAERFYQEILSRGGVDDPSELYRNFRGHDPDTGALLRRSGLQ